MNKPILAVFLFLFLWLSLAGGQQSSLTVVSAQTSSSGDTRLLKFEEVEPGIEYGKTTSGFASKDESTGPWFINALRVDLKHASLRIVHALDEGVGLETVSSMASRYQAAAATNGGYFRVNGTYRGECLGLLVLNGKLVSEPRNDRAAFGLIANGEETDVVFGHLQYSGEVSIKTGKREVQGVNRPVATDELIVFTPEFHRTTLTGPEVIEVVVREHKIVGIHDLRGSSPIPVDGLVVAAAGKSREWLKANAKLGARLSFSWSLGSIEPQDKNIWSHASNILGAGPQLIRQGKIAITNAQEKIAGTFVREGHPRTAIAKLESGKLLLLTVDGRQPGEGVGIPLTTLSELLLELGAVEALNLDGGGSTTMVLRNQVVNRPSDATGERPVSDAILVFPRHK